MRYFIDAHVLDGLSQGSKTYLSGLYSSVLQLDRIDTFYFAGKSAISFGKEIDLLANVRLLKYKSSNKFFRLGIEIPDLIRKNKIDRAHFQYISTPTKKCFEIVTIHDLLFLDYPAYFPVQYKVVKNFLFKRSAQRADVVLTVSEYSKASLIRHYGIDSERIIITPNGILDSFWNRNYVKPEFIEEKKVNSFILYVSRFEPRKNHAGLLQAYIDLKLWEQDIQLMLVGGIGIRAPKFDNLYQSLPDKIKSQIIFLNDLPLEELKWLYQECILFVYPSFAEGFGIPPLEAIACGANVICSNTTAMAEFSFLGDRLFNPFDQNELVQKIKFYLNANPHQYIDQARKHIQTFYKWDASAKRYLGILGD